MARSLKQAESIMPMRHRAIKRPWIIEMRHLKYFVTAAEQGSFRKAGQSLEIQESAISRCVRDLEDKVGTSLFHRHNWGITLTFAGQRFLPQARRILRSIEQSVEDLANIGRGANGRLRIGIFSSLASGFLTELLRTYDRCHANVEMVLVEGNPDEHVTAIRRLEIDVAFIAGMREWPGCDTTHLWSERIFAVLPVEHLLCMREQLDWRDLTLEQFIVSEVAPGPEIRDHLVRRLASLGCHPDIQPQFVGRDNLLSLVAVGRGLTLVSEATVATQMPGITYRPIANDILSFSAIWSKKNDNPAFRRLLSLAKEMSRSLIPCLLVVGYFPI